MGQRGHAGGLRLAQHAGVDGFAVLVKDFHDARSVSGWRVSSWMDSRRRRNQPQVPDRGWSRRQVSREVPCAAMVSRWAQRWQRAGAVGVKTFSASRVRSRRPGARRGGRETGIR
ncbi:hypothetical protein SDC9_152700 [bioreactor metagenome]|uniref:Uncharacterized protein n=1 Tax=bioreactor metagenome TaxID=1076179 RepID=A0A645EVH8_9ZZZZ